MLFIRLFFLVCFLVLPSLNAKLSNKEKSFYAISSLCYHTQSSDEANEEEPISFTSEEISNLWSQAESSGCEEVIAAKHAYYENRLPSANQLLNKVWNELSSDLLKKEPQCVLLETYTFATITKAEMDEISPYLLSISHPHYQTLNAIFRNQHRPLKNMENYLKAGFEVLHEQPLSHIIVSKHPELKGYLVKNYLDSETTQRQDLPGWKWLLRRCQGAENIRNLLKKYNFKHFSVPDKYLYLLQDTKHYSLSKRQQVILLVTDMKLVSKSETKKAWATATKSVLDELYAIFSHGYSSTWLINNIPYTKAGKFSCIDTEYPKRQLKYDHARKYFSEEMQAYWDELIRTGGNP